MRFDYVTIVKATMERMAMPRIGEDMGLGTLTAGGDIKWHSNFRK